MKKLRNAILPTLLLSTAASLQLYAATQRAASCSTSAVQAAVNAANNGDTVLIPDGSCSWTSGISTNKQIWIRAENYTPTKGGSASRNVIITNNASVPLFSFTTGDIFHAALSGIRINEGSGGNNAVEVRGSGSKVFLLSDMFFEVKSRYGSSTEVAVIDWSAQGGVIWNTRFIGLGTGGVAGVGADGASLVIKGQPRVWNTSSTMGTLDTNGNVNLYVEDCSCLNMSQFPDADDHARAVWRYNTLDGCWGLTHGFTSTWGGRHAEYYNNTFSVTSTARNHQGRNFWIRAGTALFTDNVVNNAAAPGEYGAPSLFEIGDNTSPGTYPMSRQPGWGHNGTSSVSDPIYSWNNTGAQQGSWSYNSQPGGWQNIVVSGRDVFVNAGAKPGYSKYTYPHPMRSALAPPTPDGIAPTAPSSLSAQPISSSQISLAWTASTDNTGISGYQIERCQGASCSNFSQIDTSASEAYTATGLIASTTYGFRVRAFDSAGNLSAYSSLATATTQAAAVTDSTAPSIPTSLSASVISASQINLSWTASTDNVAVTGYRVERCQGSTCTNFAQVGAPIATSYSSTGLSASTTYRFRVRANDAAGNLSGDSSIASATTQATSTSPAPLPTGESGLASQFPGDANIQSHPDVLFADDFESYSLAGQLTTRWNQVYQSSYTRIATEASSVFAGGKSLEFRVPQQSVEVANEAIKTISPTEDTVFVRVYTKFEAGYSASGSTHNGIAVSAQYSTPGVPANGTNKFYVDVENSRDSTSETTPGRTNVYIYHPEQRSEWGDHWYPDGRVVPFDLTPGNFGPYFVARPDFTPQLSRWYCYELMVKANTPGQRDGRVAVWIDGNLVADFLSVRLRDVSSLKIDRILIGLHIGSNTVRQNMKWYDNVVVARSYIGPMSSAAVIAAPTNLRTSVQ